MLFCSACGDLTEYGRCINPSCKSFKKQKEASPTDVPINPVRRKIPEEVGSYKNKGILGYYGYTITDPPVVRRRVLLRLYHDKLITNTHKKNHDYITLLGPGGFYRYGFSKLIPTFDGGKTNGFGNIV